MIELIALLALRQEAPNPRAHSVYRFSVKSMVPKRLKELIDESEFDTICPDPKATPEIIALAKGKVAILSPKALNTAPNRAWRNATIEFVNGRISPATWIQKTKSMGETFHMLSYPGELDYRTSTATKIGIAGFGQQLLIAWNGIPCIDDGEAWQTRWLPDNDKLLSWVLAMNDYLGPSLYHRATMKRNGKERIEVLQADKTPGLLAFRLKAGKSTTTWYFNNGPKQVQLPKLKMDFLTINANVDFESKVPKLNQFGFAIEIVE